MYFVILDPQAVLPECRNTDESSKGVPAGDDYYSSSHEEKVTLHEELVSERVYS